MTVTSYDWDGQTVVGESTAVGRAAVPLVG